MSQEHAYFAERLKECPLFSGLSSTQLERFSAGCRMRKVASGDTIAWENDPPGPVFLLLEGRVVAERVSPDGLHLHIATLEAGEMMGELSLFLDQPRQASLRALEDCRLLVLDGRELLLALKADPALGLAVIRALSARIAQNTQQSTRRQWKLTKRIAYVVVEQAKRGARKTETGTAVQMPLSQGKLADQLGCTREALNRALRELKDDGVLEWGPKETVVLSIAKLKLLAK